MSDGITMEARCAEQVLWALRRYETPGVRASVTIEGVEHAVERLAFLGNGKMGARAPKHTYEIAVTHPVTIRQDFL